MTEADFFEAIGSGREIAFSAHATDADRTVSAAWLRSAFLTSLKRISIENAIIDGDLILESEAIRTHVRIHGCIFGTIKLRYCIVEGWFDLCDSKIASIDIRGTRFASAVWLRGVRIAGTARLEYITVGAELDLDGLVLASGIYAFFMTVAKNTHMRKVKCHGEAELSRLSSGGQCDFNNSLFAKSLSMRDCRLGSLAMENVTVSEELILERSHIDSSVFLRLAAKTLNCHSMSVSGQTSIFESHVAGVSYFEGLTCTDLVLRKCTFEGDVSGIGAVASFIAISSCHFRGELKLHDVRIANNVGFEDTFANDIRFDRAQVSGSVTLMSKDSKARVGSVFLSGTRIGGQLNIEHVTLAGFLVLEGAHISGDCLIIDGTILSGISAMGCTIEGMCSFEWTLVGGPADFSSLDARQQVILKGAVFLLDAWFLRMRASSDVDCQFVQFERGANLEGAAIASRLVLLNLQSLDTLSLRDASIGALLFDERLSDVSSSGDWPFHCIPIDLAGSTYGRVIVNWKNLASALYHRGGEFVDRQPFFELERFLRSVGKDDWGDEVHFTGRRAAGDRLTTFSAALFLDRMSRWLSGYGVKPFRLVVFVVLVVAGLALFFSTPGVMRPVGSTSAGYGCDLVPGIVDRIGLALATLNPLKAGESGGWTLSDCPVLVYFRPYEVVQLAQLLALIWIPFVVATVTKLLRYGAREG